LRGKILGEFRQISGSSRESLIADFEGFQEEYGQRYKLSVKKVDRLPALMQKYGEDLFVNKLDGVRVFYHNDMGGLCIYLAIAPCVPSEL
jgi:hypothetical protein